MAWDGLYEYNVVCAIYEDYSVWIRMGCKWHSLGEWGRDWYNNNSDFSKGTTKTLERKNAYDFARNWAKIQVEKLKENDVWRPGQ